MTLDSRPARRYVIAMGLMVVAFVGAVPALNIAMDPLGYARAAGWRPARPSDLEMAFASSGQWPVPDGTREAKILNVRYYAPESVYFGSSTVWSYIDSGYAPLRTADGRRAYNFGIAGASARELLTALEHVVALKPPSRIVIGMEFYMFSADKPSAPGFDELPFAHRPGYQWNLARFVSRRLLATDYTYRSAAMLWKPIGERLASWVTPSVQAAGQAAPKALMSRDEFQQLMIDNDKIIITALYPDGGRPYRFVDDAGWSSLNAIRRIVEIARAHRIELTLYISPNHARSYEAIRLLGWWPQFEAWQRGLVEILAADEKAHPGEASVPLWDFCCYTTVTTDPIAQAPGEAAGFKLFADSIHFKTVVGFMVMDRIFRTEASKALPHDFGVLLAADNLDSHQADIRAQQAIYTARHPDDVSAVAQALKSLGREPRVPR